MFTPAHLAESAPFLKSDWLTYRQAWLAENFHFGCIAGPTRRLGHVQGPECGGEGWIRTSVVRSPADLRSATASQKTANSLQRVLSVYRRGLYDVRLMKSAVQALHEFESAAESFNALVTDIRLQDEKDGWQIARRARELNPLLPVVYMSGDSAGDHTSQGVPESIIVQKPFAAAQIVTAVSTLINKLPPSLSSD